MLRKHPTETVSIIISVRKMKWTRHVKRVGEITNVHILAEEPELKDHLRELGVDDRIIRK